MPESVTLTTTYLLGESFGYLCRVAVECDGAAFTNCRVNDRSFAFAGLPNHVRATLNEQAKTFFPMSLATPETPTATAPTIDLVVIDTASPDVQPLTLALTASKLDASSTQSVLQPYVPLYKAVRGLTAKAADLIANPTTPAADAKLARTLRLALKGERCAAEKVRQNLKAHVLAFGKAVDGLYDVVEAEAEPMEAKLAEIEKAEEIAAAKRRQELRESRAQALAAYGRDVSGLPLETMTQAAFDALVDDAKVAQAARLEREAREKEAARIAAEKAEQERLAAEQAERERLEREKAEADARAKAEAEERARVEAENARLRAEKEAAEKAAREAAEKAEAERREAEAKAKAEREAAEAEAARKLAEEQARLKAEADAAAAAAKAEADRLAAIAAEEKRKADEARAVAEEEARKEREAREALERAERERVAAEERRKAEEAEAARRAAVAPDAEKLRAFAETLRALQMPAMATDAGRRAALDVGSMLDDLVSFAVRRSTELVEKGGDL